MLRGLREGEPLLGFEARLHVGTQRLGQPVGRRPVVGDLRGGRVAGETRVVAKRPRKGDVHLGSLAGEQIAVGGLVEEGVAEGGAVRVRHEHPLVQRGPQRAVPRRLGQARDPGHQVLAGLVRPAVAATRSTARASSGSPAIRALRTSHGRAGRRPRGQQLLGEERVAAARACRHATAVARLGAEDPRHMRRQRARREPLQLDALRPLLSSSARNGRRRWRRCSSSLR